MLNHLTKQLYAKGYTRENHPSYVYWSDFENFGYVRDYLKELVWKTQCGLFVRGLRVASCDLTHQGIWYCPENGNPLCHCPYDLLDCVHSPKGLNRYALCPCYPTQEKYDYEASVEKAEDNRNHERKKHYMEITGGQYCACVVESNGYNGGILEVKYDVEKCIRFGRNGCENQYCSIRKKARDLSRVNIFYDIRRVYKTRKGFLEDTKVTIEKGVKVFAHPIARTDAEIWMKAKTQEFDPFLEKTIIPVSLSIEDLRMEFFSKHHRKWPGYDYFEFEYSVENIRIERRETRDLRQDLQDVANGIQVVHASDLVEAAKEKKRSDKEIRLARKKERQRKRREEHALSAIKEGSISSQQAAYLVGGKKKLEELLEAQKKEREEKETQFSLFEEMDIENWPN